MGSEAVRVVWLVWKRPSGRNSYPVVVGIMDNEDFARLAEASYYFEDPGLDGLTEYWSEKKEVLGG